MQCRRSSGHDPSGRHGRTFGGRRHRLYANISFDLQRSTCGGRVLAAGMWPISHARLAKARRDRRSRVTFNQFQFLCARRSVRIFLQFIRRRTSDNALVLRLFGWGGGHHDRTDTRGPSATEAIKPAGDARSARLFVWTSERCCGSLRDVLVPRAASPGRQEGTRSDVRLGRREPWLPPQL